MKKFLSILLSLTLLLSVVALPIGAVDAAAMYTETSAGEVSAGDTFTYTISLSGSYMGYACSIPVIDGLTVETITKSDTDLGKATNVDKKADGSYLLSVLPSFDTTDAEKSLIATVTVKVNDDAPVGTITLSLDKVQVANSVGDKVADLQTHFASISVVEESVPVAVTGVALDQTASEMNIGDTLTLHATVSPDNADNKSVTWKSDNTTVAVVANGVVTAKAAGSANITVTTADGGFTASCAITVKEDTPSEADVVFTLSDVTVKPGEEVLVEIFIKSSVEINSVGLKNLSYDESVFTFDSFTDFSELVTNSLFGASGCDNSKKIISLAYMTASKLEGKLCSIKFKVNSDAADGTYDIAMTGLVKNNSIVITSTVDSGSITVKSYVTGDMNGDESVDLSDALLLFQYSMFPDDYPIEYSGNFDLNKDGTVDVQDALLLFQYSMFPDDYPID